jgi:hypothetical protein
LWCEDGDSLSSRHACKPWIDRSFSAHHSFAGKATKKAAVIFSLRLFAFWVSRILTDGSLVDAAMQIALCFERNAS